MPSPQELRQQAKAGNPQAIAALISQSLKSKGTTAKVSAKGSQLKILLESEAAPSQVDLSNPDSRSWVLKNMIPFRFMASKALSQFQLGAKRFL